MGHNMNVVKFYTQFVPKKYLKYSLIYYIMEILDQLHKNYNRNLFLSSSSANHFRVVFVREESARRDTQENF